MTGAAIRAAIAAASDLTDPRLHELDWDAVATELGKGRRQYRVVYQREGLALRTRRTGSRDRAERFVLFLHGRYEEATGKKRGDYRCCNGWNCGCGGETWGDHWDEASEGLPRLISAEIQSRPVLRWEPLP